MQAILELVLPRACGGRDDRCAVKSVLRRVVAVRQFHTSIRANGKFKNRIVYIVGAVVIIIAFLSFVRIQDPQ